MDDILLNYMAQVYTPEYIENLELLFQSLDAMQVTTHTDAIQLHLPVADQYEPSDFCNEVVLLVRGTAVNVLEELGLSVSEDITNDRLATVVRWVGEFDSSEDDEMLLGILDNETDDKEVFMQFIGHYTATQPDEWVEYLHGISPEQISNMHTLITGWIQANNQDLEEVTTETDVEASVESRVVTYAVTDPTGMVERMTHDGVPMGVSIEALLNVYTDHVLGIEDLDTQIHTLLAMHLYSGESRDTLHTEVLESVRGFVDDVDVRTEMRVKRIIDETISGMEW